MIKSSTLLKKYLYILINFNEFSSINYYAPLITSNILSQYPCRITSSNTVAWNISRHYSTSTYYYFISNSDSRQNNR